MRNEEPTVFVVDDDAAVRGSLRWLLESAQMNVETYSSAEEFLAGFASHPPGCLVLDVRMPGMNGLTLQEQLTERHIDLPVIIITGHADVPMAVKAMKGGAVGFIEKPFDDKTLLESIRLALRRNTEARTQTVERNEVLARLQQLTSREHQVFELVVQGRSNKEIASGLGIADKTVEVHRASVMRKMRADTLAHLIRLAMTVGI